MKNQFWSLYLTTFLILLHILVIVGCGLGTDPMQGEDGATQITLKEILRLGDESAGDTTLFGSINQIMVNGRGDIIVAERRPLLISTFGADGEYLNLIGGYGQGPGEYQYLGGGAVGIADSVYLWEFLKNQILVYDPVDFSYVRSIEVKDYEEKQYTALIGTIENGWIMTRSVPPFLESDDGSATINPNDYSELIKIKQDGSYDATPLATVDNNEMIYNIEENGGFNFVTVPFGRSPTIVLGQDDVLYYGWNDEIKIMTVSADGSNRDTIRYTHNPVPITSAEMAEEIPEDEFFQELLENRHEPYETKAAFQTFVVDEMNRIWIKLSSPEEATEAEWLILDQASHLVGHITLPVAVDLEVIRDGYAYGIHQGDDLAPMVVVYEIQE